MKKIMIIMIIAFNIFINPNIVLKNDKPQDDIIYHAFKKTNSTYKQLQINCWGHKRDNYLDMNRLDNIVLHAIEVLGIQAGFESSTNQTKEARQINIIGQDKNHRQISFVIRNEKSSKAEFGSYETYVSMNIISYIEEDGRELSFMADDYMQKVGILPRLSRVFIGVVDGKIEYRKSKELLEVIKNAVKGKYIEGVEQYNLLSQTGYSRLIDKKLSTPKGNVNFNAAIRYNSYEDMTYIWLGTPIITIEY